MQSIILFIDIEKLPKKLVFGGALHAANVIVNDLYKGCTDKQGYTEDKNNLAKGEYQVIDLTTNAVELEVMNVTNNDLEQLQNRDIGRVGYSE